MRRRHTVDTLYENFADPTQDFLNEPRAFCYDVAAGFISKARFSCGNDWRTSDDTVKGILLLLFTWNFAARVTKVLTYENVRLALKASDKALHRLEGVRIEDDITPKQWKDIRHAFSAFMAVMGQTGASKALSLMNPDLFVMWDTKIRRRLNRCLITDIFNGEKPEYYITYLRGVKSLIVRHDLGNRIPPGTSLAKKIDEFNYAKLIMG